MEILFGGYLVSCICCVFTAIPVLAWRQLIPRSTGPWGRMLWRPRSSFFGGTGAVRFGQLFRVGLEDLVWLRSYDPHGRSKKPATRTCPDLLSFLSGTSSRIQFLRDSSGSSFPSIQLGTSRRDGRRTTLRLCREEHFFGGSPGGGLRTDFEFVGSQGRKGLKKITLDHSYPDLPVIERKRTFCKTKERRRAKPSFGVSLCSNTPGPCFFDVTRCAFLSRMCQRRFDRSHGRREITRRVFPFCCFGFSFRCLLI